MVSVECWGYSVRKRILSIYLFWFCYSISSKIPVFWAYACSVHTYTEHSHARCMWILTIRMHYACVCWLYACIVHVYFQYTPTKKPIYVDHMDRTRKLSIRLHSVSVYAQHTHVNPISLWAYTYTFLIKKALQLLEIAKFQNIFFRTLLIGLNWKKNNDLLDPSTLKKSVFAYAEHTHARYFYIKTLIIWSQIKMCWLKNIRFEPPHNKSSNGEKKIDFKNLMLGHL